METFHYVDDVLHAEQVALDTVATEHGTPCYVYSRAAIESRWRDFDDALSALEHLICYSVKANSNLGVLDALARLGSGFDIVSAGELERVLGLCDELAGAGVDLHHLNVGGGLGVRYRDESPPSPAEYAGAIAARVAGRGLSLIVEPGRALVAEAGVLLTRVRYTKLDGERRFVIVDAAMNDLLRPALYDAWHEIVPVRRRPGAAADDAATVDVVGPVCESADFLGKARRLDVMPGELLAVCTAGAYGSVMSPRAPRGAVRAGIPPAGLSASSPSAHPEWTRRPRGKPTLRSRTAGRHSEIGAQKRYHRGSSVIDYGIHD